MRFFGGLRDNSSFENLSKNSAYIDAKTYAIDVRNSYNLIDPKNHVVGKLYTYNVESTNLVLHNYLACFARKTYCVF